MNKKIAEETSLLALRLSSELDTQLQKIQEECRQDDIGQMRSGVGFVKGLLYTDIMEPIWRIHPDLRLQEMDVPGNLASEVNDDQ